MASVADQIRSKNEQLMAAFRAHDAAAVAAMYSGEARLLPPGAELVSGANKIEAFWADAIRAGLTELKLDTIDVDLIGGYTAVETGRFTMYAGRTTADRGKYMVIWRNEDGQWRAYRDIWNSSVPVSKMAAVGA